MTHHASKSSTVSRFPTCHSVETAVLEMLYDKFLAADLSDWSDLLLPDPSTATETGRLSLSLRPGFKLVVKLRSTLKTVL